MENIVYKPIGIIHSPFKEPKNTPIQPAGAEGIEGRIEVFPEYSECLKDIEGFSHIIIIYHFHLINNWKPLVKPYMDENFHGVFATRAPARPNSIGLSIVNLVDVNDNILIVKDIDVVDKTPLIDIKPYTPDFDIREVKRIGWLEKNIHKLPNSKDDGRFLK